jgi:predicted small integral membrane protein
MKILLVLSVALWALFGLLGNLTDWDGTVGAVAAVTSMATLESGAEHWQATSNKAVILAGAVFILLGKAMAGLMCLVGTWRMWSTRGADAAAFNASKTVALTGCAVAVFMLFMGWIVIAETWFELWNSNVMRGPVLGSAFRYGGMIALIALFVSMRDD